jgi:metal-responsive CopG/Arc/MetJ family transcriptional regulator
MTKAFVIEMPEDLFERFYQLVGTKFRSRGETYAKAMQSAVMIALTNFLESLEAEDKEDRKV